MLWLGPSHCSIYAIPDQHFIFQFALSFFCCCHIGYAADKAQHWILFTWRYYTTIWKKWTTLHNWNINKSREIRANEIVGKQNVKIDPLSFLLFTNFLHTQNMKHISNLVSIYFSFSFELVLMTSKLTNNINIHTYIFIYYTLLVSTIFMWLTSLFFIHCFAYCISGLLFPFIFLFVPPKHRKFICFVCARRFFLWVCVCSTVKEPHDFDLFCLLPRSVWVCVCDLISVNERANDSL